MNTSRSARSRGFSIPCIEGLEDRRLMSVAMPTAATAPIEPTPVAPPTAASLNFIHAEKGESFTAVLGTIPSVVVPATVPNGFAIHATIDWGDNTTSAGTLVHEAGGAIAVEGTHTYAMAGLNLITVTLTEVPPPGSLAPVVLLNRFYADASVIASPGGQTVEATAGTQFTANVGEFSTTISESDLIAEISWGDGTTSVGKILATPVAGAGSSASPVAGGEFVVDGTHTYAKSGSYLVSVIVLATVPPPTSTPSTSLGPPIILVVADIESVIEVLPGAVATPA